MTSLYKKGDLNYNSFNNLIYFLWFFLWGLPKFFTNEALINYGFNIDNTYKPLMPIDRLKPNETYVHFYTRSFNIIKHLSNLHQMEG